MVYRIPISPNTDVALQLAIAYIWLTEGTYDQEYLKTHAVGFDKFADYVMGKEDGVAKTPTWASPKCGVPSRIIKALAREWAKKRTTVCHGYGGPYIRGSYSSEPARMEICPLGPTRTISLMSYCFTFSFDLFYNFPCRSEPIPGYLFNQTHSEFQKP